MKDPKDIKKVLHADSEADELLQLRGEDMIEVEVAFISIEASSGSPILFLREKKAESRKMFPIWIAQPEAQAIQWQLKGETPPRPLTHDLMKNVIENLGTQVSAVYVHALKDHIYFGQIDLVTNGKTIEVDARSSDAIAIALRFDAPIYAAARIIQETGFLETELKEAEKQQSQNILENLDDDTLDRYTV